MPTDAILFSLDLEDHTGRYDDDARYVANTYRYLDWLDEAGITGTFFTVGRVAGHKPALIHNIVRRGHEIACHSLDHTRLPLQSPDAFRDHTSRAKAMLEDASGAPVIGYRAPIFSLTPQVPWAPQILAELGFAYSSSVLPSKNPLFGYPGLPQVPFRWQSGLVEFPVVLGSVAGASLPFLGGFYLRYLPQWLIRHCLSHVPHDAQPWTYIHPYDIDSAEPGWRMAETPAWVALLLRLNRSGTFAKLDALKPHFTGSTFANACKSINDGTRPIASVQS